PRRSQPAAPALPLRRRRGGAGGARRWPRRRHRDRRQRPARHARAPGRARRQPGGRNRARQRLPRAPVPAHGWRAGHPGPGRCQPRAAYAFRPGCRRRAPTPSAGGSMIRVCLVDDQTLVRQGIRSLLALDAGIEVIAEAGDGRQAVELIPQVRPDVVLMDMRMPVMSGLEALQALSRSGELPPTIILTTFDDDQLVLAGMKAGARGYLLKDV